MSELDSALAKFGGDMFDLLFEEFCEGAYEIEIGDLIQIHAVKAGLVEKTEFDPEKHDDVAGIGIEPGDDWWCLTEIGRQAIRKLRTQEQSA